MLSSMEFQIAKCSADFFFLSDCSDQLAEMTFSRTQKARGAYLASKIPQLQATKAANSAVHGG